MTQFAGPDQGGEQPSTGGDPGGEGVAMLAVERQRVETQARKHRLQKITSRLDAGKAVHIPDGAISDRVQFRDGSDGAEGRAVAIYGLHSEPMHATFPGP
jgi:hypothetical protein